MTAENSDKWPTAVSSAQGEIFKMFALSNQQTKAQMKI